MDGVLAKDTRLLEQLCHMHKVLLLDSVHAVGGQHCGQRRQHLVQLVRQLRAQQLPARASRQRFCRAGA